MPAGSIRRDATIGLAALRRLTVLDADGKVSANRTKLLRRYILGLSLVALTAPQDPYLRQGCNLVPDIDNPREFKIVNLDGTRPDVSINHDEVLKYARAAAKEFGIGKNREERFDASLAEKAGEAKLEKFNGSTVTAVDLSASKFKAKKGAKHLEFSVSSTTVIVKGEAAASFESVVVAGAKLDIEYISGAAVKITGKKLTEAVMSKLLCVTIRFLDPEPTFNGKRDGGEPEWPPSPLRLFQALVDAAASRWRIAAYAGFAKSGLEWLQQLNPPLVIAPKHYVGVPFRIAVPNNDLDVWAGPVAKGNTPKKQPNELKTMKTVTPCRICTRSVEGAAVRYVWTLSEADVAEYHKHHNAFAAAAQSITHLGWGVDMVAGNAEIVSETDIAALDGEHWKPDSMGTNLRVPAPGTLNALMAKQNAFLHRLSHNGFKPVPTLPISAFRVVGYRRANEPIAPPYAVFELRNDDGSLFGYRQDRLIHIAGMVRHLSIEAMRRSAPAGVPADWVETYVAGHRDPESQEHRQFSYLPLPSIGHRHADPSVRRLMIVAPLGDGFLLEHLAKRLDGQQLKPTSETELNNPPTLVRVRYDKVAGYYTKPANSWASVTPVILPGHDDHKPDKTRKLIEKALRQAGVEQSCEYEWSAFSLFPKSLSAHKYDRHKRLTGYIRPDHLLNQTAVHLKLRFSNDLQVSGPLVVGAGRHCGFGLFAAVAD